jgi:hypothetical protein
MNSIARKKKGKHVCENIDDVRYCIGDPSAIQKSDAVQIELDPIDMLFLQTGITPSEVDVTEFLNLLENM